MQFMFCHLEESHIAVVKARFCPLLIAENPLSPLHHLIFAFKIMRKSFYSSTKIIVNKHNIEMKKNDDLFTV